MELEHSFIFSAAHPCFAGHFPENPIVPGVLLLAEIDTVFKAHGLRVTEITFSKFLHILKPEQSCTLHISMTGNTATVTGKHAGITILQARVNYDG